MGSEVTLSFTGPVRRPRGVGARGRVALPPGRATVATLLTSVGFAEEELTHLRALVDGAPAPLETELQGGEQVIVFLPVGGG